MSPGQMLPVQMSQLKSVKMVPETVKAWTKSDIDIDGVVYVDIDVYIYYGAHEACFIFRLFIMVNKYMLIYSID